MCLCDTCHICCAMHDIYTLHIEPVYYSKDDNYYTMYLLIKQRYSSQPYPYKYIKLYCHVDSSRHCSHHSHTSVCRLSDGAVAIITKTVLYLNNNNNNDKTTTTHSPFIAKEKWGKKCREKKVYVLFTIFSVDQKNALGWESHGKGVNV